jgi:hypothetical protein
MAAAMSAAHHPTSAHRTTGLRIARRSRVDLCDGWGQPGEKQNQSYRQLARHTVRRRFFHVSGFPGTIAGHVGALALVVRCAADLREIADLGKRPSIAGAVLILAGVVPYTSSPGLSR